MLEKLLAKLTGKAATEWRGSSGETVAQRKARQERDGAKVLAIPGAIREFIPSKRRSRRAEKIGRRLTSGTNPRKATAALSFRPLGSRLSLRVRKNLRWGHTWIARKIAASKRSTAQAA